MSDAVEASQPQDLPTFSECVVGYRAWRADAHDQLWPLSSARRPWLPGINTARCNCGAWNSLRFEWSWHEGRRVLEPAPEHAAPADACTCGLYSWRRPKKAWYAEPVWGSVPRVVGAVACWGHLQVHDDGFRAEHACIVTLAYHHDTLPDALPALKRIAARYRVELVPLGELEQAASRHGTPLPDALRPSIRVASIERPPAKAGGRGLASATVSGDEPDPTAPGAGSASSAAGLPRRVGARHARAVRHSLARRGLRLRITFLAIELAVVAALVILAIGGRTASTRSSFVQRHGSHVSAIVRSVANHLDCDPYGSGCLPHADLVLTLLAPLDGQRTTNADYPGVSRLRVGQKVTALIDPRNPRYAELPGTTSPESGNWFELLILAAIFTVPPVLEARQILRITLRPNDVPRPTSPLARSRPL